MKRQLNTKEKVKVLVLTDAWYPIWGGGQVNIWEVSHRIALKKNYQVEIVTRKLKGENDTLYTKNEIFQSGQLKVTRLGICTKWGNFLGRMSFLLSAFVYLLKEDFDILHVHPFLPALPAKLVSFIKGKKIVLTVHGTRLFEKEKVVTPSIILENYILTKIKYDLEISVTESFLKFKNNNKKVIVIPNGIDINKFSQVHTKKTPYLKIIWVGRFDPVKRVEDLIEATKIASKKVSNLKLVLVGYGYEKRNLEKLVEKLKLPNVEFVGERHGKDLIQEYKSSHIFVLSSGSEGLPLTLLEAQAASLPVVATNVGGIPEVVKDGVNGFLVPPKKPKLLAQAIVKVLKSKNDFGGKSFENAKKFYSWERVSQLTEKVYRNLIT